MPKIDVSVPHSLGQTAAVERIQKLVTQVKAQFADRVSNVRETWKENVGEFEMTVMGFDVSGVIRVETDQIHMSGQIPFAALPFRGRIESAIRDKAKTLLA
jgi:hypothetical protein